ncbi:hypothetical protein PFISCL1PPCAC_23253, partial [Pristionchus fissidentatus]
SFPTISRSSPLTPRPLPSPMRSSPLLLLLLFLPSTLALDLHDVNDKALKDDKHKSEADQPKLDCIKDIGVEPLESLRSVKPYYQIFVLDLTVPQETFSKIRLLFVQAVCLYAAASNHIRIGYVALVNKNKVSSEPSIPDIREFIGMWTEPDEKLLNGVASARSEAPLTHCEKADLLGHIIKRFKRMTQKPFRFLIIDDQNADSDATSSNTCDQAFEFGKALYMRNVSLDNFVLDEVAVREQDHKSGKRMVKEPVFTMPTLDSTREFMDGMRAYIDSLQKQEMWTNERLKTAINEAKDTFQTDEAEYDDDEPKKPDVEIDFVNKTAPLGSDTNMTNSDYDDDEIGVKVAIDQDYSDTHPVALLLPQLTPNATVEVTVNATTVMPMMTSTANATTTAGAVAAAGGVLEWWIILLIVVAALILAFVLFIVFCCWYDGRKLKTKMDKGVSTASIATTSSNNLTPRVGVSTKRSENSSGSSSKRPLKLNKNYQVTDRSAPEAPLLEKNLPDPYSPVKYISTPVPIPSEIDMTNTEHVVPPTMDEALNKHVVTPMEKVPELHLDDYNI